jgi:hypothetical protein
VECPKPAPGYRKNPQRITKNDTFRSIFFPNGHFSEAIRDFQNPFQEKSRPTTFNLGKILKKRPECVEFDGGRIE